MGLEAPEMNENNIPHVVDQGASVDDRWERLAKIEKTPIMPHESTPPVKPKCESCNTAQGQELHTCPFAEEIYGDKTLCNCCDVCENACCQSI